MSNTAVQSDASSIAGAPRAFIERILGEQRGNAVLALVGGRMPNGKPRVNRPHWFSYPAQLDEMVAFAEAHAAEDLYLSPIVYGNRTDSAGRPSREKHNALTSQTIYMDSDSCPPERFRIPPSVHVDSSPGHGHDYWVLAAPIPAKDAADIAHRITTAHRSEGTDPSGWSQSKYLRMPTVNLSYGQPYTITWRDSGEVYLDLDVLGAYDDVPAPLGPEASYDVRPTGERRDAVVTPIGGRRPDLLEGEALAPLYDLVPASNRRLVELLEHVPKDGEKGWRSEQRWGLLLELCRAGFDDQQAMSLAWHASASGKWREDARGVEGLWGELIKARTQVNTENGVGIAPAPREVVVEHRLPSLLTEAERALVAEADPFPERYCTWAATRVPVMNRPLHVQNAWTWMAVVYSDFATVWKQQGPLPLNLYSVSIAESSSGKSEAARLMKQALEEVYPVESPLIPADQSRNALAEALLRREGAACLATADEADETFRTQRDSTWANGVTHLWTEVYDGTVPAQGRQSKQELSRAARARVSMHMVGTPDAIFDVLDRSMFKSGYMVRHVWTQGLSIPVTRETIRLARPGERTQLDIRLIPRYWADRIWRQHVALRARRERPMEMTFTNEAYERMDDARWDIDRALESFGDSDLYRPMARRMLDVLLKAAGLTALAAGRDHVQRIDVLGGLAQVEVWLNTALQVVDGIAASAFSRNCDHIFAFVAGREAREVDASRVYSLMKGVRPREVDEYLDSLVKQGRLEAIVPQAGGARKFRVKGE